MITNVSTATSSTAGADAMKKATGMNKDDFLKMFVTQMQNQDPLNPLDGTQFLGQLAQLTQVEQAYNTTSSLEKLIEAQNNTMALSAVSFIGKDVTAPGSQFTYATGGQPTLNYTLPQAVDQVKVQIYDGVGTLVRTLSAGASGQGQYALTWDGKDSNNQAASPGTYSFTVTGTASGQSVSGTSLVQGPVTGVKLDGSTPVLTVGGMDVPLSSVLQVKGG